MYTLHTPRGAPVASTSRAPWPVARRASCAEAAKTLLRERCGLCGSAAGASGALCCVLCGAAEEASRAGAGLANGSSVEVE